MSKMNSDSLLSMIPLDHESLLLFLPFGCGYLEDDEAPLMATRGSIILAISLQGINVSLNPSLKYPDPNHLLN